VARAYIALGSNLEPELHLLQAARQLRASFPGVRFSASYLSPAQAAAAVALAADYVNAAATFETNLAVGALHGALRDIEIACGRRRDAPGCALDLDLLWYGDVVGTTPVGPLPRPELLQQSYQLGPLAELAPQLLHPFAGATLAQLWAVLRLTQPPLARLPLDLNKGAADGP
jgi:2-amino-4-hydroxy-6-hydroxymethyldihydropteridine diphosphokinase